MIEVLLFYIKKGLFLEFLIIKLSVLSIIMVFGEDGLIIGLYFIVYNIVGFILRMIIKKLNMLFLDVVMVNDGDGLISKFFFLDFSIVIIIVVIELMIFNMFYIKMKVLIG